MSYETYKILHLLGILMVFSGVGGAFVQRLNGANPDSPARKMIASLHGTGLLISVVAGFGMLAKLGMTDGIPGWALGKLLVWIVLGGSLPLLLRLQSLTVVRGVFLASLFFGSIAAWLAVSKPF
jgi:hypothetical protein